MNAADFEGLLKAATGLHAASIGASAIDSAVRERQRVCRLSDGVEYWDYVRATPAELQALIELVVVPETWFFRDPSAFVALGRNARALLQSGAPGPALHLLSVPCSTGEEPYSMAMALLDAGLASHQFHVDGIDISRRALAHAATGVYGKSAFRAADLSFRDRYFESTPSGHRISETVRALVDFRHGNLLRPTRPLAAGRYDIILCRNLLIYFDRSTQDRAIEAVSRLLAPNGLLFVGSAETGVLLNHGFVPTDDRKAFAFRRAEADRTRRKRSATARRRSILTPVRSAETTLAADVPLHPAVRLQRVSAPRTDTSKTTLLDEGTRLANAGRFAEAADRYREYLQHQGPSAHVFHLLGVVLDAEGRHADAAAHYRKALYLDPHHEDTLVHLALLMETQNNKAEAQLLRQRARRVAQEGGA